MPLYFTLNAELAEMGTMRFEFAYDAHVYYNQIYGVARQISRRRFGGLPPKLQSFDVTEEAFERARQLVSSDAGPPPIAREFDEFGDGEDSDAGVDSLTQESQLSKFEAPKGKRKARGVPPKAKRARK